jgi:hypothetical protein
MERKVFYLILALFFSSVKSLAQDKSYFNQTEIGFLLGRSGELWDGNHQERLDFSAMTFHGTRISKNHVVGFSVGYEQYDDLSIIPIAIGWRGFLGKVSKPQLFAGLDMGGGSTVLEKTEKNRMVFHMVRRRDHVTSLGGNPVARQKRPWRTLLQFWV